MPAAKRADWFAAETQALRRPLRQINRALQRTFMVSRMAYKSILVHVDPTQAGRTRVRGAAALALQWDARLIGLAARSLEPMIDPAGVPRPRYVEGAAAEMAEAEQVFRGETAELAADRAIWRTEQKLPTEAMLQHCAGADLIVASGGVDQAPATHAGAGDLIIAAGAPVLCLQNAQRIEAKSILVGWKDTRETRRAVTDALPLLKRAASVHVISFAEEAEAPPGLDAAVGRLKLHGVRVAAEVTRPTQRAIAEDFVAKAKAIGADLIVAGGYGHSRLREWALGGATRGLLEQSAVSVLFSH